MGNHHLRIMIMIMIMFGVAMRLERIHSQPLDPLHSAAIPIIRDLDIEVLNRRMNQVLQRYTPRMDIQWRPSRVTDVRGYEVPAGAEILARWDNRPPRQVFLHGLRPRRRDVEESTIDLYDHVNNNGPSLFVATTRPFRNMVGHVVFWEPWSRVRYRYEIFANGGIDVNLSLGEHEFTEENEVAFLGGVRPELIRRAMEYKYSDDPPYRRLVRYHVNGYFDVTANGGANPVHAYDLPPTYYEPGIERIDYPEANDELKVQDEADDSYIDDIGHNGSLKEVPARMRMDGLANPIRTAFPDPKNPGQAYFFADNRFILMQMSNDSIIHGPNLTMEWDSLRKLGFPILDAALYVESSNTLHFFSQDRCGRVDLSTNTTMGPFPISEAWNSTLGKSNFSKVDAILPYTSSLAYFFSDDLFILVDTLGEMDLVTNPSVIIEQWPALKKAEISSVDAAIPSFPYDHTAYFFKGTDFAVVEFPATPSEKGITTTNGSLWRAKDGAFQSLRSLGFYGDLLVDE